MFDVIDYKPEGVARGFIMYKHQPVVRGFIYYHMSGFMCYKR